ncbi:MAG: LysR substrate-binding domain-containing protein [Rhizobiaceae bacterium]
MTNWLPSLNSLRAFEVVSRHLNYHSAATELNVTPAAVKQLVSKLEESVGTKLLERKGQGLALTPRGKASCEDLTVAMARLSSSVETMRRTESQHQLIVTVETSFATAWLVPKLDRFRVKYPQISVLIDSNQQIADLAKGQADIAIRYGVNTGGDYFVHRLFDDEIFPACSPAMANGPPKIENLDDLNQVPLIHWDMSQIEWARATKKWFMWDKWLSHIGVKKLRTDGGLYFSDYGLAVQAAIAGQGVILASWPILREPIESGLLVCPFKERVKTDIGYDLVTVPPMQQRTEVKAFVDWIIATATIE